MSKRKALVCVSIIAILAASSAIYLTIQGTGRNRKPVQNGAQTPPPLMRPQPDDVNRTADASLEEERKRIAAATEYEIRLERWAIEMAKYDKETMRDWDLSAEQAKELSTAKLIIHYIQSPLTVDAGMHNDPNMGIERVIHSTVVLSEALSRQDFSDGVVLAYNQYPVDPSETDDAVLKARLARNPSLILDPRFKKLNDFVHSAGDDILMNTARYSLKHRALDRLLMHPKMFAKLNGHEEKVLGALVARHKKILASIAKHEELSLNEYGAVTGISKSFALLLTKRINEPLYDALNRIERSGGGDKRTEVFFAKLEEYLKASSSD